MSSVDIIILVILLWGAFRGWKSGFIKEVFSSVGIVAGLVVAILFYSQLGEYFTPALGSGSVASFTSSVLAFIIIWVVVPIVLSVVANVLTRTAKGLHAGPLNSISGLLVGMLKYFVLISFVFSAMAYVGIISEQKKNASLFYPYITLLGNTVYEGRSVAEESGELKDDTVIIPVRHHKDSLKINGRN